MVDCVTIADGSCQEVDEFITARDILARRKVAAGEYTFQPAFTLVNMPRAHAALELTQGREVVPGTGVRVSILDSGLDVSHRLFDGVDITVTLQEGATNDREHGTGVATVVAGNRVTDFGATITPGSTSSTLRYTGVVPGADVDLHAIPIGEEYSWPNAVTAALGTSPHFMNLSFGFGGIFVENFTEAEVRAGLTERIAVMRQTGVSNPTVFVFAAGNNHGEPCNINDPEEQNCLPDPDNMEEDEGGMYDATSPSPDSALPVHIAELRDRAVAVVSVGTNGDISDFSNRCGVAGPWCIAAPGEFIFIVDFDEETDMSNLVLAFGTSYSAPLVTGGLAMMRQFFRGQLSNPELLARMYATANKEGKYADMEIYGQGLADFGAAMSPVGTPLIQRRAAAAEANEYTYSIDETRLHLGSAFGDSVTNSLAGHEVAAFDNLGAPFWYKLTSLINTNRASSQPSSRSSQPAYQRLWNFPFPEFPNTQTTNKNPAAARTKYITTFTQDELSVAHGDWQFGLHQQLLTAKSSLLNITGETMALTYALSPGSEWQLTTFAGTKRGEWLQQLERQHRLAYYPLERQRLSGRQYQSEQQHRLEWQRQSEHRHRLKQWHQSKQQHQLAQQHQSGWQPQSTQWHQSAQQRRQQRHQPERGALLSWRPPNSTLGVRMGVLGESAGLLGSYTRGAFGKVATTSTVAGLEWSTAWRNWQIAADVELGMAQTNTQGGLLDNLSGVTTSAASLYARRSLNHKNSLMFSLSQPARVEQGELLLKVPAGQTLSGELLQQNITAQLRPSGRQLDLTAHWHHNNLWGGQLRLATIYSHHLGHIAGASDYGMLLGWQAAF